MSSTWGWLSSGSLFCRTIQPFRLCFRRSTQTKTNVLFSATQRQIWRACIVPDRYLRVSICRFSVCIATNSCSSKRSETRKCYVRSFLIIQLSPRALTLWQRKLTEKNDTWTKHRRARILIIIRPTRSLFFKWHFKNILGIYTSTSVYQVVILNNIC